MVSSISLLFLLSNSLLLCTYFHLITKAQPIAEGLSWSYYDNSCPKLQIIVRKHLRKVFKKDVTLPAALLRLHFHDCFVLGCDGSIMLDGSASGPSEKDAPPNLSLRKEGFEIISGLQNEVIQKCGKVVSCADILALSARDAVYLSGGPDYDIPLGRRDGLKFATRDETLANLPPPSGNTTTILNSLATKGFNATDVVALSGGHTIGISHCTSFTNRLYPSQDPIMDKTFAKNLKQTCPSPDSNNTTVLDIRSPYTFDNKYYVDLMNRQGLFTSDQDLYTDSRTRGIVVEFALNQKLFYLKFVAAMIKMSQLNVLTGSQGEIRDNCSVTNSNNYLMLSSMTKERLAAV